MPKPSEDPTPAGFFVIAVAIFLTVMILSERVDRWEATATEVGEGYVVLSDGNRYTERIGPEPKVGDVYGVSKHSTLWRMWCDSPEISTIVKGVTPLEHHREKARAAQPPDIIPKSTD